MNGAVMKFVTLITLFVMSIVSTSFAHENDFIDAIKYKPLKTVKKMLDEGADPNTVWIGKADQKVKPAVFFALESERVSVLKLLIIYGADLNVTKTGDGIIDNNLLMVAFRRLGRKEARGKTTEIIKLLLDKEFEVAGKRYTFDFNPYARGGVDGDRDAVSIIYKNFADVDSLTLLYTHKNIEAGKFKHRKKYITQSIAKGNINFLNRYLEFNADRVSSNEAKKALEKMSLKYADDLSIVNAELSQRLREIAF